MSNGENIRCRACGKLLAVITDARGPAEVEIKCPRCKRINRTEVNGDGAGERWTRSTGKPITNP